MTVVGDDDQSIYRFRGAAMSNIVEFRDRDPRAGLVVLRRNYRSRTGILAASHRLIRFNDPDRLEVRAGIDKRLRAMRPEPPAGRRRAAVRQMTFATGSEEADWVAAEIARRIAAGATPRDHAILIRSNAEADPILRSLNLAGVAWRFSGTSGLYARPEVRLLLAFLRAVADLGSSVDVYALAASETYGLGGDDLTDDRGECAPPESVGLGRPRGSRPPAGPPASGRVDPVGRAPARRRPAPVLDARPRSTGGRGPLRVPARDGLAGTACQRR